MKWGGKHFPGRAVTHANVLSWKEPWQVGSNEKGWSVGEECGIQGRRRREEQTAKIPVDHFGRCLFPILRTMGSY